MSKHELKTDCERCGTCCMKGGPALHSEDKNLLEQNFIGRGSLITVRRGEPVFALENTEPEWASSEFIKLKGKHTEWTCVFYDQSSSTCLIYEHRPLECILLKCWDTIELEAIAGKELLSRFDIIASDETIIKYIKNHENECSLKKLERLFSKQNGKINKKNLAELTELVNKDLALRTEAVMQFNLNLDFELFYFGRPLFKILSQFGLDPREVNGEIKLIQD